RFFTGRGEVASDEEYFAAALRQEFGQCVGIVGPFGAEEGERAADRRLVDRKHPFPQRFQVALINGHWGGAVDRKGNSSRNGIAEALKRVESGGKTAGQFAEER